MFGLERAELGTGLVLADTKEVVVKRMLNRWLRVVLDTHRRVVELDLEVTFVVTFYYQESPGDENSIAISMSILTLIRHSTPQHECK